MSAPNAELAYKVLDHIAAHPEQWRQRNWLVQSECGTAGCIAGWTCLLSGEKADDSLTEYGETARLASGEMVSDRAQQLLGASRYLADTTEDIDDERDLFDERNTLEDLVDYVAEIFGPRPHDNAAWHACAHRADFASAAEHDRDCPAHGIDVPAGGAQ